MKEKLVTTMAHLCADVHAKAAAVLLEAEQKHDNKFKITIETLDESGSLEQNNAWHALLGEYWRSGLSSYLSLRDMRDKLKLRVAGVEEFVFIDDLGIQHTTEELETIPFGAWYVERPKSWRDFTKKQRMQAIDDIIDEMHEAGVASKKFDEIILGLYI